MVNGKPMTTKKDSLQQLKIMDKAQFTTVLESDFTCLHFFGVARQTDHDQQLGSSHPNPLHNKTNFGTTQ